MGEGEGRLQAALDVIGDLVGRFVVVHRHRTAEIAMRGDGDPRDDRFDVAPMIEQRGEAGPRLLVHAVALVEDADPAADHGGHEGRGVIVDLAALAQDRRDEQIFGPRVGRALVDEERLRAFAGRRHRQGRLADAGRADDPRGEREVLRIDDQPAGEDLLQDLPLPDPRSLGGIGGSEIEPDTFNFVKFSHSLASIPGALFFRQPPRDGPAWTERRTAVTTRRSFPRFHADRGSDAGRRRTYRPRCGRWPQKRSTSVTIPLTSCSADARVRRRLIPRAGPARRGRSRHSWPR